MDQVLHEETLEAALTLLRFQLLHNVAAFHDSRLQKLYRPALADSGKHGRSHPDE